MRNTLLFSLALGLVVTTEASAKVVTRSNLHAATAYSSGRLIQNTVQGTVSDSKGPLSGVTVSVVGIPGAVTTDADGKFKITAALGATIRFSSVGYLSKDIKVTSGTVNVLLESEDNALEEVVVVGYGTQKKEHLTGAVSSIDVEKVMGSRPIPDAARGMQGTIPGLSVVIPSGEVGSDAVMKIRGQVASSAGSSNPLILVDNVEVPSINMINPSDIESISVLKDAASASIYGSKAAFGVVLITTKKGAKTDSHSVTYSNNLSLQSPFKKIDIAGIDGLEYTLEAHKRQPTGVIPAGGFWRFTEETIEKMREWERLYGGVVKNGDPVVYGRDWFYDGKDKYGYRIYDPVDMLVKDQAFSQIHNIGLSGKSGKTQYNLSAGYLGQQGMMKPAKHDDFTRYNGTLNLSSQVHENVQLRGGVMYSNGTKRYPNSPTGYTSGDAWVYLYRWSRLFPTGSQENGQDIRDPYFDIKNAHTAHKTDRYLNLNLGTTIDVLKGWDIKADYAYSTQNNTINSSMPTYTYPEPWYAPVAWNDPEGYQYYVDENGVPTDNGGILAYKFPLVNYITKNQSNIYNKTLLSKRHTFNAFSTYQTKFNEEHDFKFMVGTNITAYNWNDVWARKFYLINEENPQFNFATGLAEDGGDANWDSQVGFFGRANYVFKDKYLLEANLRYDGSSKFPPHLRWRWYPSVSAGWVVSNENFMKGISNVLTFAKLRGSWGNIGDQSVPNSLYVPILDPGQGNWVGSTGQGNYQLLQPPAISTAISWQNIEHTNVGADLRFFNKLGVVFELFERNTRDMIVGGLALPNTFGANAPQGNYGNLRTRGWELNLDFNHRFDNGLRLSVNANLADAISVTTKGADWNIPWENRSLTGVFSTGRTYGDIYGYVTDRLYQASDFVYDANGNFQTTTIIHKGSARETNMLAGANPVYQTQFQDAQLPNHYMVPGDVKFVDIDGDGYITNGSNTNGDPGDRVVIGNSTPRYEYGFRLGADYKGFDFSVFLQGVGKREIWGAGQLAIPGFHTRDGAMPQTFAADYWREDRTDAFYPRPWNLQGEATGHTMVPQTRYLLDMSYFKVKNITIGYALQENTLKKIYMKNVRLYVSLENMFLFDKLRGLPIDPETISGNSMFATNGNNYNQGRTGAGTPAFKSASLGLQIGF